MPLQANRLSGPILCYVTDRNSLSPSASDVEALVMKISAAIAAGINWIQIREKDLSGRDCAALTSTALSSASQSTSLDPAKILVNDRLDVALAARAHGVHLGERSLLVHQAKELASKLEATGNSTLLIGASCHALAEAQAAAADGADYLIFGPIFETPSKASFGTAQGLNRLAQVCEEVAIPVLAIGGITLHKAADCIDAGAAGIAAIRLFQDTPAANLPDLVRTLRALPTRFR